MNGNLFENTAGASSPTQDWITAHCDGGSRGNPGPAGFGAVVEDSKGQILARLGEFLGIQTNNFAEYSGLLAVLKWALQNGYSRLRVISDSELMVKQMKGQYRVSSPALQPLWHEARTLARQLDRFEISHTLRGGNKEADRLANEAMDKGTGKDSKSASQQVSKPAGSAPKPRPQVFEGFVKNGVVHLLNGELPEGIFVKVTRE
jgi:ribonuclease HI